jgi:CRP/FNR family cyclic AMP-dependent transcriptional regulator
MIHHALIEGVGGQEGTFLVAIPPHARDRLMAGSIVREVPAGSQIFSAADACERVGIVIRGMARTYLTSGDGRRLTVRFVRPGSMIGSLTVGRAALSVQAVVECTILELDRAALLDLMLEDGRVGVAMIGEITRRLEDTYLTLANNTFGSMRERVARHLLDLATEAVHTDRLVAPVTQQALADGVGTVREVVARILRDFRTEGVIETTDGCIEIVDLDAIASIVRRSQSNAWETVPINP